MFEETNVLMITLNFQSSVDDPSNEAHSSLDHPAKVQKVCSEAGSRQAVARERQRRRQRSWTSGR